MLIKMWKPDLEEFLNKVRELDEQPKDCIQFIKKLEVFLKTPLSGNIYFDYEDIECYNALKTYLSSGWSES